MLSRFELSITLKIFQPRLKSSITIGSLLSQLRLSRPPPLSIMTTEQPPSISEAELQELCDCIAGTETSLLHGYNTASPDQHAHLEPKLKRLQNIAVLYEVSCSIRRALQALRESREIPKSWVPKGNLEHVVRACCNQRYEKHDLEQIFYENGDIYALLVLHWGTKSQTNLLPKICALPPDMIADLAKQLAKEMINSFVVEWVIEYDRSKSIPFFPQQTFHD
jgi:hypothetical protein